MIGRLEDVELQLDVAGLLEDVFFDALFELRRVAAALGESGSSNERCDSGEDQRAKHRETAFFRRKK